MWTDKIVEETRQAREAHAAQFNYDLEAIYRDLKTKELQSGRRAVSLSPRQPIVRVNHKVIKTTAA